MPHTVKMAGKKILVKEGIHVILESYAQSISSLPLEQKNSLGVSDEERSREGILASVQSRAESATGTRIGAKERWLSAMECNLSDFAFELRDAYIGFLNRLIQQSKKTAAETQAEKIESRYVLIREILLRVLTVALSDEENNKRNSEGLVNAMQSFTASVLGQEGLRLNDAFRYTLCDQHPTWVGYFKQAVEITQLIHLPQSTFTDVVNYLDTIKRAIQVHILVGCGFTISASDISEEWIKTTYGQLFLGTPPSALLPYRSEKPSLALTTRQAAKLATLKQHPFAKHLQTLFLFFNESEILSGMVAKIDSLIKDSGWALLLTRKLTFDELVTYLQSHQQRCEQLLAFEKLGIKQTSDACRTLVTSGFLSGKGMTGAIPGICQKIRQLGSLGSHELMLKKFAYDMSELLEYGAVLGIQLTGQPTTGALPPMASPVRELTPTPQAPTEPSLLMASPVPDQTITQLSPPALPKTTILSRASIIEDYVSTAVESTKPVPTGVEPTTRVEITEDVTPAVEPIHPPAPSLLVENTTMQEKKSDDSTAASDATSVHSPLPHEPQAPTPTPSPVNPPSSAIVNETQTVSLSRHAQAYTRYLQSFFEEYADGDYHTTLVQLEARFFEQQTHLGGKMAGATQTTWNMDEWADPDNFLYLFRQNATFRTAAPFCVAVKDAIQRFETYHMDQTKPTQPWLTAFNRDVLWEGRHRELFYFKFLCVKTAQTMGDERNLSDLVERFIELTECKIGSDYNALKSDLRDVMKKSLGLRKYLGMTPAAQQAAEIARLKMEKAEMAQRIADLASENIDLKKEKAKTEKNHRQQTKRHQIEVQRKDQETHELRKTVENLEKQLIEQDVKFDQKFEKMRKEMQEDMRREIRILVANTEIKGNTNANSEKSSEKIQVQYQPLLQNQHPRKKRASAPTPVNPIKTENAVNSVESSDGCTIL